MTNMTEFIRYSVSSLRSATDSPSRQGTLEPQTKEAQTPCPSCGIRIWEWAARWVALALESPVSKGFFPDSHLVFGFGFRVQ